jgi:tetratricopeptide (TPR) repeat protein
LEKTLEIKRKAQRFVQNGDLDKAVEEYHKLLAADDSDPYTHVTLGDLYFKKGLGEEAGRRYQEAAEAYRKAGLVKNAIAVCKKMLRLNLRAMDTLRSLAELHAQDGLALDSALYYSQYADLLLGHDRKVDAAEALEKASRLLPDEPKYAEKLGEMWSLEGEKLKASRAMIRAAKAYEIKGQMDQAVACRARAEEFYPGAESLPEESPAAVPDAPKAGPEPGVNGTMRHTSTGAPSTGAIAPERSRYTPPGGGRPEGLESSRIGGAPTFGTVVPVATAAAPPPAAADEPATESQVPPEVGAHLDYARTLLAAGEREQAAEALLRGALAWESVGGLEQAASIYNELSRSPQASERLYRLWLANCERRQQWVESAAVCCELGDLALAAQEPSNAHEWFVQARAYDPNNEMAARRLERLSDWGKRRLEPQELSEDRVTVQQRMPEDLDVDLSELLSAFQAGVREQVQADDASSHYDLGMTYRQMGLLDEAVAEFRLAARDPEFSVKCTDMLGRCLLERGDFGAAIAEFERGLSLPGLTPDSALAFRYSLGLVLEASGRPMEALEHFESVFATQPNYPDVAAKIRELRR